MRLLVAAAGSLLGSRIVYGSHRPDPTCVHRCLETLEVVTQNAAIGDDSLAGAGDAWGGHQSRIVRTSRGDVFVSYLIAGKSVRQAEWRVARRQAGGWRVVGGGVAGREPASLLRTPDDRLLVVAWPDSAPTVWEGTIAADTVRWRREVVPGPWVSTMWPYLAAGISANGRLCVLESITASARDRAAHAISCRETAKSSMWSSARYNLPNRFAYAIVVPSDSSVSTVASRDVLWSELGLQRPTSFKSSAYVFNSVRLWTTHTGARSSPDELTIHDELPNYRGQFVQVHPMDMVETKDGLHILYNVSGPSSGGRFVQRQAVVKGGKVTWDGALPSPVPATYAFHRMVLDERGSLRWLFASDSTMAVFNATSPDGHTFDGGVRIDLRGHHVEYAGIFVAAPRGGTPWSSGVDLVFPNAGAVYYAHIRL